jgi:hypothetical protein
MTKGIFLATAVGVFLLGGVARADCPSTSCDNMDDVAGSTVPKHPIYKFVNCSCSGNYTINRQEAFDCQRDMGEFCDLNQWRVNQTNVYKADHDATPVVQYFQVLCLDSQYDCP